jgi:hypothetical protein
LLSRRDSFFFRLCCAQTLIERKRPAPEHR